MNATRTDGKHETWSTRFGFLMAAIGFAVGLGNIWRFPYMTGENGGAAFVLVYVVSAFLIGVPILIAEILIGRRGGLSPPNTLRKLALQEGRLEQWKWVGGMNLLAAFLIEIVYCVIAGWVLLYLYKAAVGDFSGMDADGATAAFDAVLSSTGTMLGWTWLGLLLTGAIIYAGVQKGIERAVSVLMPALFALLLGLMLFNVFSSGFTEALDYLFSADFDKINGKVWLAAIGQAFFSIGVAMAGMMTFGAYLPRHISISSSVAIIIVADTVVALVAGLVVFPAVFRFGLDPEGGPGLIFHTLPVAFAQMPAGRMFGVLFFLLLSVAAITSMVGLIESMTAWLEEKKGYRRHRSALAVLAVIGGLSLLSILSYNELAGLRLGGRNLNDLVDYVANQILLPLGGLLIALFAGWFMSAESTRDELAARNEITFRVWRFLVRWPVPAAVAIIFIMGVSA